MKDLELRAVFCQEQNIVLDPKGESHGCGEQPDKAGVAYILL